MLASLPPVTGLYAALLPVVLYMMMGTSRHLSQGVYTDPRSGWRHVLKPLFANRDEKNEKLTTKKRKKRKREKEKEKKNREEKKKQERRRREVKWSEVKEEKRRKEKKRERREKKRREEKKREEEKRREEKRREEKRREEKRREERRREEKRREEKRRKVTIGQTILAISQAWSKNVQGRPGTNSFHSPWMPLRNRQ